MKIFAPKNLINCEKQPAGWVICKTEYLQYIHMYYWSIMVFTGHIQEMDLMASCIQAIVKFSGFTKHVAHEPNQQIHNVVYHNF